MSHCFKDPFPSVLTFFRNIAQSDFLPTLPNRLVHSSCHSVIDEADQRKTTIFFTEYEDHCHDVPEQKCYTAHEDVCSTVQVLLCIHLHKTFVCLDSRCMKYIIHKVLKRKLVDRIFLGACVHRCPSPRLSYCPGTAL